MDEIVRPALFSITCTTCRVRLAVRGVEAVGAILECPKCGCMVPVIPPEGWQPPKPPEPPVEQAPAPVVDGQTENADAQSTVAENVAGVGIKASLSQLVHSLYFMIAAAVAVVVIGIGIWVTMFSGNAKKTPAAVEQSSPEQPAANKVNESTTATAADAEMKPAVEPVTEKPTEKIAEEKPQTNSEPSETKQADAKEPEQKAADITALDANTPADTKTSTEEKASPTGAPSEPDKQATAPAPAVIETSKMVKLIAPDLSDVQSRLAGIIPKIEFQNMPFARAIGLASALSGLPITLDPDALIRAQVTLRDPVTVRLIGATVEQLLQEIVAKRGLSFVAEDGQVVITNSVEHREKLRKVHYTVSDLTGNGKTPIEQLAVMLQKLVAPESWQSGGGQGIIETDKTALIVTQTSVVHDQIIVFCEKLRNARGMPLKSKGDPKRFDLTTRFQQSQAALSREVIANFHEPAALVDILAYLGQQAEVDILLDRQNLGVARISDKSEISFVVENRPLAVALNDLLAPQKLAYRAIDAHTLQVSTRSALDARMDMEFYPIRKLLDENLNGPLLVEQIKATVSPDSWKEANSSTEIYFDQPSGAIIVRQSPRVHEEILLFLNKMTANIR